MLPETCKMCGEALTDDELAMPMDDPFICDDCVDDLAEASLFEADLVAADPYAEHRLSGSDLGLSRLTRRLP